MEIPPPPLVGRPVRYNDPPTLHITDPPMRDQTFLHSAPSIDPSPLFALSLAPAPSHRGKYEQDQEADPEDRNVRALFCMMIQMQNIMKNLQDNVGRLESRVTILETEGRFNPDNPPSSSASASEINGNSNSDGFAGSLGSMTNGVIGKPENEAPHSYQMFLQQQQRSSSRKVSSDVLSASYHNGMVNAKDVSVEYNNADGSPPKVSDGISDVPGLFVGLFQKEDCTPKTNSRALESQIPFISRRTLWKKANKPKWKRRSDIVPRLKEIVNEKFKAEDKTDNQNIASHPGEDSNEVQTDFAAFTMLSEDNNLGVNRTSGDQSGVPLATSDAFSDSAAFQSLLAPAHLAPIWRSTDATSDVSFPKVISTEGVNAIVVKASRDGVYDERPTVVDPLPNEPVMKPEFMCSICFKVLGSKSSLDTHTRSIHENRKFPCTDCGKRFFDRSTLRRHKKCIHENITHRCKFCSLEFSRRHYLTSHVQKEHPGKIAAETAGNKESVGEVGQPISGVFHKDLDPPH